MAKHARRFGPYLFILVILVGITALLVPTPRQASATPYTSPWWTDSSPTARCASCQEGCDPKPSAFIMLPPGYDWPYCHMGVGRTGGEFQANLHLTSEPGIGADFFFGIRCHSYLSGGTQVGKGAVLSFEHTVEYEELDPGDPEGNGGHQVTWRRPDGMLVIFDWDGTEYSTTDCSVQHTLTHNSPYKLTDQQGNVMLFDTAGMPDKYTDRNGAVLDFTYNA